MIVDSAIKSLDKFITDVLPLRMEQNIIYNEDCLDTMAKMENNSVDVVITSPPYNLGGDFHTWVNKKRVTYGDYHGFKDNLPEDKYQINQIRVINECLRVLKPEGSLFYVHKNRLKKFRLLTPYEWLLKTDGILRQEIVWDTTNEINQDARRFIPCHEKIFWLSKTITHIENTDRLQDCWVFRNKLKRKDTGHPATYPMDIVRALLNVLPHAKIVYDPYMGSGTTALVCIQEGRSYIGSEISKHYYEIAMKRIEEVLHGK